MNNPNNNIPDINHFQELGMVPVTSIDIYKMGAFLSVGAYAQQGSNTIHTNIQTWYSQKSISSSDLSSLNLFAFFKHLEEYESKESLYITGIKNLRKKINFIRLDNELNNEEVSEEDYEQEINNNPDKYIVDMDDLKNENDIVIIRDIINKIGGEFTIDEVGEMFSIDTHSLKNSLSKLS